MVFLVSMSRLSARPYNDVSNSSSCVQVVDVVNVSCSPCGDKRFSFAMEGTNTSAETNTVSAMISTHEGIGFASCRSLFGSLPEHWSRLRYAQNLMLLFFKE